MKTLLKSHHPVRHIKSFHFAFKGITHTIVNEPNFRIQIAITLSAFIAGLHYKITNIEWGLLIISMGMLLSAELTNTVVEEVTDNFVKEFHEGARIIKDVSAGFVLITALTALAILFLVFCPKLF